jgi:hypothetical protein
MSNTELLIEAIKTLPADYTVEVLDFVGYLKEKAAKKQEECPICAKHRDPKTGELNFNTETITAFEEGMPCFAEKYRQNGTVPLMK